MDEAKFLEDFKELCERYNVADFAFVVRDVTGESFFSWFAGISDGANEIGNRERAAALHFELHGLAGDLLRKQWMPVEN
jgi:hypothetical protein